MGKISKVIKIIAFLIILLIAVCFLQERLIPYHNIYSSQFKTFYETPSNSIDVLIVGTSTVMVGISPLEIYENTGIVAHNRGNSTQPPQITYFHIKESLSYQRPKVIVCSVRSLFWEDEKNIDEVEYAARNGMDYSPMSLAKLEVAYEIAKESDYQSLLSYIFPIIKYHSTWKSFSLKKTPIEYDYHHGQYAVYKWKNSQQIQGVCIMTYQNLHYPKHRYIGMKRFQNYAEKMTLNYYL